MLRSENTLDEFEIKLQVELENIQKCQSEHNVQSCLKCEQIIGCVIRKSYVKAVYESMNKGASGGFEF